MFNGPKIQTIKVVITRTFSRLNLNQQKRALIRVSNRQFVEPIRNGYGYYRPPYNSLAAALESIARNDELHCVPRLLCELTSGASGKLPFDINGESVLG